jgi:hypothetical protein
MHDRIAAVDPYYGFADSCFPALLKQEKPLVVEPCRAPEFTGRCLRLVFRLVSKVAISVSTRHDRNAGIFLVTPLKSKQGSTFLSNTTTPTLLPTMRNRLTFSPHSP